jgi:hypothetical protein
MSMVYIYINTSLYSNPTIHFIMEDEREKQQGRNEQGEKWREGGRKEGRKGNKHE